MANEVLRNRMIRKLSPVFRLWRLLPSRRRWQITLLLTLMIAASLSEVVSIGALIPFLNVMVEPSHSPKSQFFDAFILFFDLPENINIILLFSALFAILSVVAGILRLILLWANTRVSFGIGSELSRQIFDKTIYQPYSVHVSRNSSEIISGVTHKANELIYGLVLPTLTLLSSLFFILLILGTLMLINVFAALSTFAVMGLTYAAIIGVSRHRLISNSRNVSIASETLIKLLQETLGGIREILIDGTQSTFSKTYRDIDSILRISQRNTIFIGASPRYLIETLGICVIVSVSYFISSGGNGSGAAIPIIGAVVLGAQRLLPVVQQAYASWVSIIGSRVSVADALGLLEQPIENLYISGGPDHLDYNYSIELSGIGLIFEQRSMPVLEDINLIIKKGSRIGFIGSTGSGKSSLMDVIMGLLKPTSGNIYVDGVALGREKIRSWQKHIAHVPQHIFLADVSIAENIAFGIPKDEINMDRVKFVAIQAQIDAVIESLPDKFATLVGEHGIRLSGGQRQRIGIARALYKKADFIVFDEATSALDEPTESSIMNSIYNLSSDVTLLIVAHRTSTLQNCDFIVKMDNGKITSVNSFAGIQ